MLQRGGFGYPGHRRFPAADCDVTLGKELERSMRPLCCESLQEKTLGVCEPAASYQALRQEVPRGHGSSPRAIPVKALDRFDETAEQTLGFVETALANAPLRLAAVDFPGFTIVQPPGAIERLETRIVVQVQQQRIVGYAPRIGPSALDRFAEVAEGSFDISQASPCDAEIVESDLSLLVPFSQHATH